jgi:hypothetical protein
MADKAVKKTQRTPIVAKSTVAMSRIVSIGSPCVFAVGVITLMLTTNIVKHFCAIRKEKNRRG